MNKLNQNFPNNQLSHHHKRFFQPEKLSKPRHFFIPENLIAQQNSNDKPLTVLEIGAGKGMHAMMYAANHPEHHLIAIERTRNKFEVFAKRAAQHKLQNLTPIHADAIAWIVHAIAPSSLERIYILYPNPEQHNPNQQWLNMPFFEFLLSRLKEEGQIVLATNIEAYMDNAEQKAKDIWNLQTSRYQIPSDSARTHFEIKYLARQEVCWELDMRKPKGYRTRFDNWHSL